MPYRCLIALPMLLLVACAAPQQPAPDKQLRAEVARLHQKLDRVDEHLRALHADVGRLQREPRRATKAKRRAARTRAASQPAAGASPQATDATPTAMEDEGKLPRKLGGSARLSRSHRVRFTGRFPGAEGGSGFTLRWKGSDRKIKLHSGPSDRQRVIARAGWKNGAEIATLDTLVLVKEPRRVKLRSDTELPARPYDWRANRTVGNETALKLAKGTVVDYYQYASEGDCFIGHEGLLYLATCSVAYSLTAVSRPKAQEWWVRIKHRGISGWIHVSPKLIDTRFHGP